MRVIAGSFRSRSLAAPPGFATRPTSDRLRETLFNVLSPRIQGAAFLDLYAGSGAVGIEALSRGAAQVDFVERAPAALKILHANLERLGIATQAKPTGFGIHSSSVSAFLCRDATALSKPEGHDPVYLSTNAVCQGTTSPGSPSTGLRRWGEASVVPKGTEKHVALAPVGFLKYDAAFLDPPWDAKEEYAATMTALGSSVAGLLAEGAVVIAEHRRKMSLEDRYGTLERTRLLEQGDAALSFYVASRRLP
jgi:16S rRNA (guanine966-N2)-methyltransferase